MLDMAFREDLTRLRSGNAPENTAIVRHVVLTLLSRAMPITSFNNRR
jgi:predicted transposase YbfD/YdcC